MTKKTWVFDLIDNRHEVILDHGIFSGKREISIDGVPLESSSKLYDLGSVHKFDVDGYSCVLRIKQKPLSFIYELYVDGNLIEPVG
jgi:hypothetical protein